MRSVRFGDEVRKRVPVRKSSKTTDETVCLALVDDRFPLLHMRPRSDALVALVMITVRLRRVDKEMCHRASTNSENPF